MKNVWRAAPALGAAVVMLWSMAARGDVKVEKVAYFNQPNCLRLSNGTVEVIVTTDIGPRIIRYGFIGGDNILGEVPDLKAETPMGVWKPYGGHRLWIGPESKRLSYGPDSDPVKADILPNGVRLTPPFDAKIGFQKEMTVTLDPKGTLVTIQHKITNLNIFAMDIAPWALTIMNGGGVTIIPQEPFISHDDFVLPARPLVLWHFTDLTDARYTIGKSYVRLKTDEALADPQKVGVLNKQGWCAYVRNKVMFVKRFPVKAGATYPDFDCNNETYTAGTFMEVESLGPLQHIGLEKSVEHTEQWYLFDNVDIGATEATLAAAVQPLIASTAPVK